MTISIQSELNNIFDASWQYNDGGRSKTKWSGTKDCGVRALAVVTGMPYEKARKHLKAFTNIGKANHRRISTGIYKVDMDMAMESLGWFYQTVPNFTNNKTYCANMPKNITMLLNMRGHFVAMQNGLLQDTFDSTNKCIIGYWVEL